MPRKAHDRSTAIPPARRVLQGDSRAASRGEPRRRRVSRTGLAKLPRLARSDDDDVPGTRSTSCARGIRAGAAGNTEHPRRHGPEGDGPERAEYIHTVPRGDQARLRRRNAYLGDPAFASVPLKGLLSNLTRPSAASRSARRPSSSIVGRSVPVRSDVKPPAARYYPHSQGAKGSNTSGDTTCVDAVDKAEICSAPRRARSWLLGGAFIAGDTGRAALECIRVFDLGSGQPERAGRRQAPAHDADADDPAERRQAVSRDQHTRRRQPGSADPERAVDIMVSRHGHPGRDRGPASTPIIRTAPSTITTACPGSWRSRTACRRKCWTTCAPAVMCCGSSGRMP